MSRDQVDDIRSRLEGIVEELDDLILETVRSAVEAGAEKRTDEDRRLTRARNAVEKAAHLLSGSPSDD